MVDGRQVGYVTSAIWSPRFQRNVAMAMVDRGHWQARTEVSVIPADGQQFAGVITDLPMQEA